MNLEYMDIAFKEAKKAYKRGEVPIGAVTHVFVNDPTRGYGIFIENMLAEAEKSK